MGDAESGPGPSLVQLPAPPGAPWRAVTSDAGLLLPRELDERLGLTELIASDSRSTRPDRCLPPEPSA